jgi:hypothetical protein
MITPKTLLLDAIGSTTALMQSDGPICLIRDSTSKSIACEPTSPHERRSKPCTGNLETVFRMPCYHTLRAMKQLNSKVDKSSFHSHRHFERPGNGPESGEGIELPQPSLEPPGPSIFAPHKVVTRRRKRKDNSTDLNLSSLLERSAQAELVVRFQE